MSHHHYWLYWVVAFVGVIAILMVGVAMQEWMLWRKGKKP